MTEKKTLVNMNIFKSLLLGILVPVAVVLGMLIAMKRTPPIPSPPLATMPMIVIDNHQSTEFEATGYAIGHPYNTITKSGQPVINRGFLHVGGVDVFTIAVDPKVIPLGSLVYIDSLGLALATDTGKAIKGMIIDICFTNMKEAKKWGRKKVNVYVLRRSK